jgi:hypothetical protein
LLPICCPRTLHDYCSQALPAPQQPSPGSGRWSAPVGPQRSTQSWVAWRRQSERTTLPPAMPYTDRPTRRGECEAPR